jgi:hypothetical protein
MGSGAHRSFLARQLQIVPAQAIRNTRRKASREKFIRVTDKLEHRPGVKAAASLRARPDFPPTTAEGTSGCCLHQTCVTAFPLVRKHKAAAVG